MSHGPEDPALRRAMELWAEDVPSLPVDFAAQVRRELELREAVTRWADDAVPPLPADFAKTVAARAAPRPVAVLRRRWLWPALAVAAVALVVLLTPWRVRGRVESTMPDQADAADAGAGVSEGYVRPDGRAEVTHVEVFGAQSYAVISADEENEAKGNPPVVWITDDDDGLDDAQESGTVMP